MSGKQGKTSGGGGMDLDDFRLWKEFTRDIDPLEEPDWEALEALIAKDSPKTTILKEITPSPKKPTIAAPAPKENGPPQIPQLDGRTEERLRKGKMPIEGTLDLHGYTQEKAYRLLTDFILNAQGRGKRCLLVITGKGKSKAGGALFDIPEGVLKQRVPEWLSVPPLRGAVLRIFQAQQQHGGSGAIYVYLKRNRD